jgi:hypothetical protein
MPGKKLIAGTTGPSLDAIISGLWKPELSPWSGFVPA